MSADADYLIVGGGTAGCVLANRLSADGARVVLLEAGADVAARAMPADIADLYPRSYYNHAYMWSGLSADQSGDGTGRSSAFPQARLVGGGSMLMGMIGLRGLPADYDGWAERGASGWAWSDVLPFFRDLEHDRDFAGELHGATGPVSVRRHRPEDWPRFAAAIGRAAGRAGLAQLADLNAEFGDGHGALPMTSTLAARVSSASAYLDAEVRARANLRILDRAAAHRLVIENGVCVGVSYERGGQVQTLRAAQTVLSSGAIQSPTLLLRSGIGPADALRALGLEVHADRPGVGQNLQNHPIVYLAAHIPPVARQSPALRPGFNTALRFSSSGAGRQGDLQMLILNKSSWHGLGGAVAGLGVCLVQPDSRGQVTLTSAEPTVLPRIEFRMLTEGSDRERLTEGFTLAGELMRDPEVRGLRHETFAAGYSRVVRNLNAPGLANHLVADALARVLDGPDVLRRFLLKWGIASGDIRESRLTDPRWLAETVRTRSFGTYHPAGTCALGRPDDADTVVDARTRVVGIEHLRVVDASIMPTVTRGNTNLPTTMIAERAAALIRADA